MVYFRGLLAGSNSSSDAAMGSEAELPTVGSIGSATDEWVRKLPVISFKNILFKKKIAGGNAHSADANHEHGGDDCAWRHARECGQSLPAALPIHSANVRGSNLLGWETHWGKHLKCILISDFLDPVWTVSASGAKWIDGDFEII